MPEELENFTDAFDVFVNDYLRNQGFARCLEALKTASYEHQDVFKPRNHIDLFYMFVGTLSMLQTFATDMEMKTLYKHDQETLKSKLEKAKKEKEDLQLKYTELEDKYFKVVDEYTEKQAKSSRKQRRRNRQQENQPEGMRSLMCALQKMRTSQ